MHSIATRVFRFVLLPLCALLVAAGPAASDTSIVTLSADAEARWVPFTLTATNQIRFTATIDDRPVTAILDTGVSYSVLAQHYAEASKIKRRPIGQATAIGGAVDLGWASVGRIAIGGLSRASGGLAVAALPVSVTGAGVDLLVGRDLTGGHALDIDYASRRFRLIPSGRLPFQGVSAPLTIGGARTLYVTEITLGGARLRPMVVDTGDGASITVTSAGWQAARLTGVTTSSALNVGLAGPATARIGIVPELRVGPVTARNVEVLIEQPGGFSDTIQSAGRIGSGFLRDYRVLLDPAAGRMVLRAGPDVDRAPERSTSGLILTAEPDRLRVVHVMAGSPAATGGWRTGEAICRVDGVSVAARYASRWQVDAPGRTIDLGLCGGGERRLTLRAFY